MPMSKQELNSYAKKTRDARRAEHGLSYKGAVCAKHPELEGERSSTSGACRKCVGDQRRKRIAEKGPLYIGVPCSIHPELYGERKTNNRQCSQCSREAKKAWAKTGRNRDAALADEYNRRRQKAMLQATPPWADVAAIKALIKQKTKDEQIDHVIPIKGIHPVSKLHVVCGLHTIDNLRIVPALLNQSKWAWFDPEKYTP